MLELFAKHGFFDLTVQASGDTEVDFHHTMEDLGLVLGTAIAEAAGDRVGIRRYGSARIPMVSVSPCCQWALYSLVLPCCAFSSLYLAFTCVTNKN